MFTLYKWACLDERERHSMNNTRYYYFAYTYSLREWSKRGVRVNFKT